MTDLSLKCSFLASGFCAFVECKTAPMHSAIPGCSFAMSLPFQIPFEKQFFGNLCHFAKTNAVYIAADC